MKTAAWYIPWHYKVSGSGREWSVHVTNSAGQHVCKPTFFSKAEADAWADEHKLERAKDFGALVES